MSPMCVMSNRMFELIVANRDDEALSTDCDRVGEHEAGTRRQQVVQVLHAGLLRPPESVFPAATL